MFMYVVNLALTFKNIIIFIAFIVVVFFLPGLKKTPSSIVHLSGLSQTCWKIVRMLDKEQGDPSSNSKWNSHKSVTLSPVIKAQSKLSHRIIVKNAGWRGGRTSNATFCGFKERLWPIKTYGECECMDVWKTTAVLTVMDYMGDIMRHASAIF